MKPLFSTFLVLILLLSIPPASAAQESDDAISRQLNRSFDYASMRILSLAREMPEEHYTWSPDGEAMTFARVVMHIARYNYLLPVEFLGQPVPEGIDLDGMESETDKEVIIKALEASTEYVRQLMEEIEDEQLQETVMLYGGEVNGQGVLMQLMLHKSEHLGQAISYARANGVVPPWSR